MASSYASGATPQRIITASVVSDILEKFKTSEVFAVSERSNNAKLLANSVLEKLAADVGGEADEAMSKFSGG